MTHRAAAVVVVLVAFLVAACAGGPGGSGGSGGSGSPSAGTGAAGLAGRTFLSTNLRGRALVAGSRIRMTFQDGRIGLSAGCNQMGGTYTLDGDRLVVRDLGTTDMACDRALMDQDAWLSEFVNSATVALDGATLMLAKGGITLTLLDREVADPDRPLLGTRWVVDGLVAGGTVSSVPGGIVAALTFTDGRVDVETGCNTGGGAVTIDDGSIAFGDLAYTKKACGPEAARVELAVTTVLRGPATYVIEAGALTLMNGTNGLMLRAAP